MVIRTLVCSLILVGVVIGQGARYFHEVPCECNLNCAIDCKRCNSKDCVEKCIEQICEDAPRLCDSLMICCAESECEQVDGWGEYKYRYLADGHNVSIIPLVEFKHEKNKEDDIKLPYSQDGLSPIHKEGSGHAVLVIDPNLEVEEIDDYDHVDDSDPEFSDDSPTTLQPEPDPNSKLDSERTTLQPEDYSDVDNEVDVEPTTTLQPEDVPEVDPQNTTLVPEPEDFPDVDNEVDPEDTTPNPEPATTLEPENFPDVDNEVDPEDTTLDPEPTTTLQPEDFPDVDNEVDPEDTTPNPEPTTTLEPEVHPHPEPDPVDTTPNPQPTTTLQPEPTTDPDVYPPISPPPSSTPKPVPGTEPTVSTTTPTPPNQCHQQIHIPCCRIRIRNPCIVRLCVQCCPPDTIRVICDVNHCHPTNTIYYQTVQVQNVCYPSPYPLYNYPSYGYYG